MFVRFQFFACLHFAKNKRHGGEKQPSTQPLNERGIFGCFLSLFFPFVGDGEVELPDDVDELAKSIVVADFGVLGNASGVLASWVFAGSFPAEFPVNNI